MFAREEERIGNTIPMPTFASRPSINKIFWSTGGIQQSSMVGQQRQQLSELQYDKSPTSLSFLCCKIRFINQVTTCSGCPSEAMLWIKEVEMFDSMDELKSSRSVAGKKFPNFEMLDAKIIHNSHFKKKVSLEEHKAPKRGPVSTRKTDRLHDLRLLSRYWCS